MIYTFTMIYIESPQAIFSIFILGVCMHQILFAHGEWDRKAPLLIFLVGCLPITLVISLSFVMREGYSPLPASLRLSAVLLSGLYTSMAIYRLFLHRLRKFPGPFLARLSNVYITILGAKRMQLFVEVERLHERYGDFVRIGPSSISVNHPAAIAAIYSTQSACTKGPFYNVERPRISLQMERDKKKHASRRKIWDHAFSTKALRDYEPRILKYTDQLLDRIKATAGHPLNVSDWFNFYSFDVMGDLSFGRSFNMLISGERHYFMTSLHAAMTNVGCLRHMAWLVPFFKIIPGLNKEYSWFWGWISEQVAHRKKIKPDRPDIFSFLLEEYRSHSQATRQMDMNLDSDAFLIAVAGSDTTAAVLTTLFFQLAQNLNKAKSLQIQLDQYFQEENHPTDSIPLANVKDLTAIINETMRLHPPVPSGVQRLTPPEGLRIGETYIPGNTIVQVPFHTLFRDPRCFDRPLEFVPERWTSESCSDKDASVFVPFLAGPYSCIGRQLALMELRCVVAQVVYRYDVAFAPGQDAKAFLDGKRDTFTLVLGSLELIFTPRRSPSDSPLQDVESIIDL